MCRIFFFLVLVMVGFASCERPEDSPIMQNDLTYNNATNASVELKSLPINANSCGEIASTDLIAGQHTNVGRVTVSVNNGKLTVVYTLTNNWWMEESQLHIADIAANIPQTKSGNPQVGKFTYKAIHNPLVNTYTYSDIDVSAFSSIVVAAHATVKQYLGDKIAIANVEKSLPTTPTKMKVTFTKNPTYFSTQISGAGILDGAYNGFCIDLDHGIRPGTVYDMYALSSYSTDTKLMAAVVDKPQNLDLVNYLINKDWTGLGATGTELQAAVWTLIDTNPFVNQGGGISWNQQIVDAIIAECVSKGEGYVPSCDGKVMVIFAPGNTPAQIIRTQVTLAQIPLSVFPNSCQSTYGGSETAWGKGDEFGDGSWAMYFNYCICPPVYTTDIQAIEAAVPTSLVNVVVKFTQNPSYFSTTLSNAGALNGTFFGNCVDLDHLIYSGKVYNLNLISTYSTNVSLIGKFIDKPENLDLVNFLINQDYSGIGAKGSEYQAAIWQLIDFKPPTNFAGSITWDKSVVDKMVADAKAKGEGFVPDCSQKIVLLVYMDAVNRPQTTLVQIPVSAFPNACNILGYSCK